MKRTAMCFVFLVIVIGVILLGPPLRWGSEAVEVLHEEFGPRELLRKYEWFKDASAHLEKKRADIKVMRHA